MGILLKAGTNIYQQQTAGAEPKKPPKKLVYQKCIRIRAYKRNIKGILICESTKRKYPSVASVNKKSRPLTASSFDGAAKVCALICGARALPQIIASAVRVVRLNNLVFYEVE